MENNCAGAGGGGWSVMDGRGGAGVSTLNPTVTRGGAGITAGELDAFRIVRTLGGAGANAGGGVGLLSGTERGFVTTG